MERINKIPLKDLKTIVRLLGYEPFNQKSWEEFNEEDYYRILKSKVKEMGEIYGY